MQIQDEIWGNWELTDPLLIELVNSQPIQRLKKSPTMVLIDTSLTSATRPDTSILWVFYIWR